LRFLAPVRIGDTVVTTCTVAEVRQRREAMIACKCAVNGKPVVEAEALVLAPKKPPLRAA
jgi:3-hydroxybutyryl-CoA dehydratase